jgi:ribosomal protein S18 acetylase RimI-like enzyme
VKIREIVDSDVERVVKLWKDCGLTRDWNDPHNDIQFARTGETSTILVGELDGQLVASVMVGHDGHRGVLYYLAVQPKFQKRGLGRATHDAAVAWLKERGVWKINLLVRAENSSVAGFYESLGYAANPVLSFGKRID